MCKTLSQLCVGHHDYGRTLDFKSEQSDNKNSEFLEHIIEMHVQDNILTYTAIQKAGSHVCENNSQNRLRGCGMK